MQEGSTTRRRLPWALLLGLVSGLALGSGLLLVVQWRNRPPIWADGPWVFFQGARYKRAVTTEFFDRFSLEQAAAEALPGAPWKKGRDEQHYTWPLGSQTYMKAPGSSLRSFVALSPPVQLTPPTDLGAFGDAFFPKLRDAIAQTGAEILTQGGSRGLSIWGTHDPAEPGKKVQQRLYEYWVFYRTPVIEGRLFGWITGNAEDAAVVVTVMEQYAGPPITLPKLLRK